MAQEQLKSRPSVRTPARGEAANGAAGDGTSPASNENDAGPRPGTSFQKFLRDILIIAVLLGGGMFAYHRHVGNEKRLKDLDRQATEKQVKEDLGSLREAEDLFKQMLAVDKDSPRALAALAETYFLESRHGLDTRGLAEETLQKAIAEKAESAERYATRAYLEITSGHAADADREMKDLIDRGYGVPRMVHAYGWALLEEGNLGEAKRVLEAEFVGVRSGLTLAEIAHRQGDERAAVHRLRKVLEPAQSPKHAVAAAWLAALSAKNYGTLTEPAKVIQDVSARKSEIGPLAVALLTWAEGELALALGNDGQALTKANEALGQLKDYPPFLDLKARTLLAGKHYQDALAVYDQAITMKPEYRGILRDLIALKSEHKDESALALIERLEKSAPAATPEPEVLRGEFYLRKGDVEAAKAAFTKAADIGDDAAILFGLAKVTFLEEKKKDKPDLERVATAFQAALERRPNYPEVHEYMARISLWSQDIAGANGSFGEAEAGYKKANKSRPQMVQFYDRAIAALLDVPGKSARKEGEKAAGEWKKKRSDYLATMGV